MNKVSCNDKRMQILKAAETVLGEYGLDKASIQMVAKEAKVAAGTIYRYFSDKTHLIQEVYYMNKQRHCRLIFQDVNINDSIFEQYRTMWLASFELLLNTSAGFSCYQQFQMSSYYDTKIEQKQDKKIFAPWFDFLERGINKKEIKNLDIEILRALSLESSLTLALKHIRGQVLMDKKNKELTIMASWNAIKTN